MGKRRSTLIVLLVSCAITLPCLWRRIVSPADLQSHLYNAWLANLIPEGRAPGLVIVGQSTNVLADVILAQGMRFAPPSAVEKTLAAALVLLLFWGAFRFFCAVAGRSVWAFCPWLAMLGYGFVFQAGFLNFYLSTALVLWALAITWNGRLRQLVFAVPLLGLAWTAHPLPVIWFVALLAYKRVAAYLPPKWQPVLCLAGIAALVLGRTYVIAKYPSIWSIRQAALVTGADQLVLYGNAYIPIALALLVLIAFLFVEWLPESRRLGSVTLQLYVLTAAAVVLFPNSAGHAGVICQRLSLYAGLLLLVTFVRTRRDKVVLFAGLASALPFFALLFFDMGKIARVEEKLEALVAPLAFGTRVACYVSGPLWGRVPISHLISRACIGHCFDYENYEPATQQFRIRALPGSPVAMADFQLVHGFEAGLRAVAREDLPLFVLLACSPANDELCIREARIGERGADLLVQR